jgi:multiple sugar transport system ATP-binding protein
VFKLARVEIKNLIKRFGATIAVNNVSLEIKDKEFVVLLGPSGCGKTTTLRCVAGLETPDQGEIYIGDTLVNELPPKDRDVAMVFQSYALYPHMTVYDNIAFPLKMRKYQKSEIDKRVKQVAELLRISHLLDRKPRQLSGGEAQRTALGRAIVREPKVFLMDEPLSNLDAKLRLYMRAELKKLQRDLGVTTIYVTHDQAEAMTMADRVAIMNYGVLQQVAPPEDLYDHPANIFVAGFIGSPPMNFIECSFLEKDGRGYLDAGTFRLELWPEVADIIKKKATSSEVILGLRPEDLSISREVEKPETAIPAEIYVIEPLGTEVIVDAKVGENIIKLREAPTFRGTMGEKVWVKFNKDRMHLFDKKTEVTII